MYDVWYNASVKGSFDTKGVVTHSLETTALGTT